MTIVCTMQVYVVLKVFILTWWQGLHPKGYTLEPRKGLCPLTLLGALIPDPHKGHYPLTILGALPPNPHKTHLIFQVLFEFEFVSYASYKSSSTICHQFRKSSLMLPNAYLFPCQLEDNLFV